MKDEQASVSTKPATKGARLKLFVWEDFCSDYTSGLAFAIAKNEAEARELIARQHGNEPHIWGDLTAYPLTTRIAKFVCGGG